MTEGALTARGSNVSETNIRNMVDSRVCFKTGNFNMEVQQHKLNTSLENKAGSFYQQRKTSTTFINYYGTSISRKIIYRKKEGYLSL